MNVAYSHNIYSGKQNWIIWMHGQTKLQQLPRKTELDDQDAWSITVATLTEEKELDGLDAWLETVTTLTEENRIG